jgi:hypothetical protein
VLVQKLGPIDDNSETGIDATSFDSRYTSRYRCAHSRKKQSAHNSTKLTVACHASSHFLGGATVSAGPSNDLPLFSPAMRKTGLVLRFDRVLGAAVVDSEKNHRLCREDFQVRSSIIPLNRHGQREPQPTTKYRNRKKRRFHRRKYGQR